MKVTSNVRPICDSCRVVRRNGVVMVVCGNHRTTGDKA